MDLKAYIKMEFDGLKHNAERALQGLTQSELNWRPACGCNSIGLILYHIARSEDGLIQHELSHEKEVWETGKWYQKLNLPLTDGGSHYTVDQVNAFTPPALADILNYWEAVRSHNMKFLDTFSPEQLDRKVTLKFAGEVPAAFVYSLVVSHSAQHIGEISYLRGLQRGMDK
jgi:hypothetical protein